MIKIRKTVKEYGIMTFATIIMVAGIYFFIYPNHFTFGGVTGLSVAFAKLFGGIPSVYSVIMNLILLLIGFIFIGRNFGTKTVYVTLLFSLLLGAAEMFIPMNGPLTDEPILEMIFAIALPGTASAMLFNMKASSGGTDIVAMILNKYTNVNIATSLLIADTVICMTSFFIFDLKTGLFSVAGLVAKSLVIDDVIENINMCKYFTIICTKPEPICEYIHTRLGRGATILNAEGTYNKSGCTVILTAMRRMQAAQLRNYIKKTDKTAFMMITKSSEVIGKGFLDME